MRRYLEAFFRHPRILAAPVAIALVIGIGYAAVQPRTYQATARVWFQTSTIAGVSNPTTAVMTPSQVATGVFQELLASRSFCIASGRRGPLAAYMAQGHMPAVDPISATLGFVQELRHPSTDAQRRLAQDDAMVALLQKQVGVSSTGPEIVTITFDYTDPVIAAGTLKAILNQFSDDVLATQRAQVNQQVGFYQQQADAQQKILTEANTAVYDYLAKHPNLAGANAPPDTTYASLQQAAGQAQQQFGDVLKQLNQAKLQQKNLSEGDPTQFRTIDQPAPPNRAQSFTRTLLTGVGGGLAAGLLIALGALTALVLLDHSLRTEEDLEQSTGLRVMGSIPWQSGPRAGEGDASSARSPADSRATA